MNIPLHLQFESVAMKAQIDQMSHEQLRAFAHTMTDSLFVQRAFLIEVSKDYAKTNRPLPFVPLDPKHFNEGAE
jgi:hypothetical protein